MAEAVRPKRNKSHCAEKAPGKQLSRRSVNKADKKTNIDHKDTIIVHQGGLRERHISKNEKPSTDERAVTEKDKSILVVSSALYQDVQKTEALNCDGTETAVVPKENEQAEEVTESKKRQICDNREETEQCEHTDTASTIHLELPVCQPNTSFPSALYPTISFTTGTEQSAILPLAGEASCLFTVEAEEPLRQDIEVARLYPKLSELQPAAEVFTAEDLSLGEAAHWLGSVEYYATEFENFAHQDGHELHELLMHYWRCRKNLNHAQTKVQDINADCESTENRLWSFRNEQLILQGVCADQAKVGGCHSFQQVLFNKAVLSELQDLFDAKAELLHQTVALYTYTAALSRLQAESYIYRLLQKYTFTRSTSNIEASSDCLEEMSLPYGLQTLKESISVLFSFTRKVLDDAQFQEDIHTWLQRLVAVLLQAGSLDDHLYLLNHLLCCPSGVGKWASTFLQIKVLDNSGVCHFMQALAILMSPVRNRLDFLCHMKPNESKNFCDGKSDAGSGNWTLVDEGGEEDEDPLTSWLLLSEDDLIVFFSQFPFDDLLKHLLGISLKEHNKSDITTSKMMRIFAFASSLVEVLSIGLETYNRARYRQFVKQIGHMIRITICYVSDHWAQYISLNKIIHTGIPHEIHSMQKLQMEFDRLFLRVVLHVLKAKRLGIWLFMKEIPYGTLSTSMLWNIYYIMHLVEKEDFNHFCSIKSIEKSIEKVKESSVPQDFECWLSEISCSDGICLLGTFAQMAQLRCAAADLEFISTVALKIYEASYVCVATKETYSKVGCDLLSAIATCHPYIISVLLDRLKQTIDQVGMGSLYLLKELPLHLWTPKEADLCLIRNWLLDHSLHTVENKLACIILESLNWGFLQNGCLALEPSVHTEVSLIVMEAYQKHLEDKPYKGIISEGIKQVSYLASVVRLGHTLEAYFCQWAWDLVLHLKLHFNEICSQDTWRPVPTSSTLLAEISDSSAMHPILKAVKAGIPIGCFLALSMTNIGHSFDKFCTEGLDLLRILVQSRHLRAVVHILDNVMPLAYRSQSYLLNDEQFHSCIQIFLQLDSGMPQGMTQQVTHKMAQHLTGSCHGENVKLLNSVIQTHVMKSCKASQVGPAAVLEFWVQVMTKQSGWFRDRTVLRIMDDLCKAAFVHQQVECIQKILSQLHKNALGYHGECGLISSLVGWIVTGNITPSFVEGNALSSEVWFSWLVLNMEAIFEEDSQLQCNVVRELVTNTTISPEQALKKAQVLLKLPVIPSIQRMMIYRWAHQALVTPADHPLLPLVWQRFLQLYMHRPGHEFGLEAKGCIGRRYFHSTAHVNLLKDLKQRLVEVSDFHHAASKALKISPATMENSSCSSLLTENESFSELHSELVRIFSVFAVWLEDENLQKQEIYLPSLPKQYDSHRLANIMQNKQDLWMEYVDIKRVWHEINECKSLWEKVQIQPLLMQKNSGSMFANLSSNAGNECMMNIEKQNSPKGPLILGPMRVPVGDISPACFSDEVTSSNLLLEDLSHLQHQAKIAAWRETQQVAADKELLESLPDLYCNRAEEIGVRLECRGCGGRPCQGPAVTVVKFDGMHKVEAVQNQIKVLKSDIKQLQTDCLKSPPQSMVEAAVHVENFITALVNTFKKCPSSAIEKVGISAFYQVVSFVSETTQQHLPTRQFFSSCIEILGQVFIRDNQLECSRVLKTILSKQHNCTLLSPFFTPNASPVELVTLYEEVVKALDIDNGDVIFMLLTKFDLQEWLKLTQPPFSERSRLMEVVHLALSVCGLDPHPKLLMSFNLFCKHWTQLLLYQFPDHYSDCLRLLVQSSSEQLLSSECWRVTLKALDCYSVLKKKKTKAEEFSVSSVPVLSLRHVDETMNWLSNYFLKLRLSKEDFQSFGLLSKWHPYIEEVKVLFRYLVNYKMNLHLIACANEPQGSDKIVKAVSELHMKYTSLLKPWILPLNTSDASNHCSYPWLETDTPVAAKMVGLHVQFSCMLHHKFKDLSLPEQRGALWFHLMQYCYTCTAPKMPEYLLFTYHTQYSQLPYSDLHPDHDLMQQFFKVERGSPKSCFLFLGEQLSKVNWVSVLQGILGPKPTTSDQSMLTNLFYMIVFLAKEELLLSKHESPLQALLCQSSTLPWHLVDVSSYQNITGYVDTHYSELILIDASSQVLRLLRKSAGFGITSQGPHCKDVTPKCQSFIHLVVKSLTSLDQSGHISLSSLENEMDKLLDCIKVFIPPEQDLCKRHMAITVLFSKLLTLLNIVRVPTAEALVNKLCSWVETKAGPSLVLPLLTAACSCLASVRHMVHITEICIITYFSEESRPTWGPLLMSLQVPELTVNDFILESLSKGSFLTLYVYILQKLNVEQTAANERRTLTLLSSWISQVLPRHESDEAKLLLWWHKALQLALMLAEQKDPHDLESVLSCLINIQNKMALLGEERLSSGILGSIGLGRKSPFSNRFRIVACCISAFLLVQLHPEMNMRMLPGTDLAFSVKAQQALATLETMSANKQYSQFQEILGQVCGFIKYPGNCLPDWEKLFALLVNSLYTDMHYLDILR